MGEGKVLTNHEKLLEGGPSFSRIFLKI